MSNRTLVDEIITLIRSEANNNPPPKPCKIVKNYGDEPYCDVEVENLGVLLYMKTIGSTKIGLEGIICFLNGDLNQGVVITSDNVKSDQNNPSIDDLEIDLNLNFGLSGLDDTIVIDMDIVDYVVNKTINTRR